MENKIEKVQRRNGEIVEFNQQKITDAIYKAITATGQGDGEISRRVSGEVANILSRRFKEDEIPNVEQIQDIVEEILILNGLVETAKAYILYREQRRKVRETAVVADESSERVDKYLKELDWQVNENANMTFSLQGLNQYVGSYISKKYWLNKIYPKEIREAAAEEDFHIHNLELLAPYCEGWDLYDFLNRGFGGVSSKLECRPPKHLRTALGQLVNVLFTLQGESAGANAVSNFDTLLAPFIRYDNLSYSQVKQAMQEFLYNCMVPTRVGFQSLCWDEIVVVKEKEEVKFKEIGDLIDREFEKNNHRIIEDNPSSYAIKNYDDFKVLSFDDNGRAVWSGVKAFIRHRVPRNSEFVKIKTNRGDAKVSKAHSLFSFESFDGKFNPKPTSSENVEIPKNYYDLNESNHFISLKSFENEGKQEELNIVDIIDKIPQIQKNVFVKINPTRTLEGIRKNILLDKESFVPFYKEFGFKDRGVWQDWLERKSIRYDVWKKYGDSKKQIELNFKNSNIWYPQILKGKMLENFVKLSAWYVAEGHTAISTSLYVSQSPSRHSKEIIDLMKDLNLLGQIEENDSFSLKGDIEGKVLKITGRGLLSELISRTGGYLSFNKVVPSFIFKLSKKYQIIFLESLLKGDASEYNSHWDFATTSKKLSSSLSFLLAQNNYYFNVYTEKSNNKNWHDKLITRIYKKGFKPKKHYAVKDFEARSCLKVEKFNYDREYEYDISVDQKQENFIGGTGLLAFHNTPFINVSLDISPPGNLKDLPVIIGGKPQKETYGDFQEEMNMFIKSFYEVLMEGDAKGRPFSVDSDCLCPVKVSKEVKLVKIGEYVDNLMEKQPPVLIKENNCQVLDVKGLDINCLGSKDGKVDWQKVNFLVRHPIDKLLKIKAQGGFNIKVTPSHSVLVLKKGQVQSFEAAQLKKGDYLISPKSIPQGNSNICDICLIEEFEKIGKEQGIFLSNVFKNNEIYQEERIRACNDSSYKVSSFPLTNINKEINSFDFSQTKLSLAGSSIKIPNNILVSKDLMIFLGWYCAEGSAEKNSKYGGISLAFNLKKEKKQAEHIADIIKRIFDKDIPIKIREISKRNLIEVRVHSKLIRRVVTEVFNIGNKEKKKVPQIVFELSNEMKKTFLDAYFKGDAYLTNKDIIATSISRELVYGVSTLLKQMNVFHTLSDYNWKGRSRWRINIWGSRQIVSKRSHSISKIPIKESGIEAVIDKILEKEPFFYDSAGRKYRNTRNKIFQKLGISHQNSISFEKAQKIIQNAKKLKINIPSALEAIEKDNFLFLKVKEVKEDLASNGMVYDFSTESENFVADQLLVHNTFPIPTVSITKDFDWDNSTLAPLWEATAKYGVNYFSNFVQSDMSPDDARSMCCRLRLDNRELLKRGGGLFGANPLTGSIGVVTINLPRIGYLSKTKKEFLERLSHLMDLAKESLEIKRKALESFMEKGLYPYSKNYLSSVKKIRGSYFGNHFSTIGIMGMNEALLNFLDHDIGTKKGKSFAIEIMDFMRDILVKYQEETDNLYNLEATPGEGTSYRQARADKEKYPDIITAGTKEVPYYTNSTQLPVGYTDDVFEAIKLQDDLQTKYTGGCVEKGNKVLTNKGLLKIEDIVKDFNNLKPIKALSYNKEKRISEWDKILEAVKIDVKKHNKIRVKGERNLDIVTSDWHPFFVLKKFKPNPTCPICKEKVMNIKGFAAHIKYNLECKKAYQTFPKYQVIEKRADELEKGDYILQNSFNSYPEKESKLNDDLAWLFGFFIGDGSISKFIDNRGGNNLKRYKVRFFSEQEGVLKRVSAILNHYFEADVRVIKNDKRSVKLREISTSKKEAVDFFFKYGFWSGEKCYNIFIPETVKKNFTKDNVFSFLAGLMDSDGHVDKKQGDFEYYTVSERLADDILQICSIGGIMISKVRKKTKRKNEVDIFRLRIPCYEVIKLKNKLDSNFNSLKIKDILSNRKKRHLPVVRVKEISKVKVNDEKFYDLMTEKNHNYLAGKNTLVFIHNTVLHVFLGEKINDPESAKVLVRKIFDKFHLPYITLTPTFSVCPTHGYLAGEHFECPKCTIKQPCEVYSRIVGYIRPVNQWNKGKKQEFKERKIFKPKEIK